MKNFKYILALITILLCVSVVEAKKKKYPNGDIYVGEWKKGMPEGEGVMTYANGDIYDGSWSMGKRNGNGIFTSPDGTKFSGTWSDDIRNGNGILTYMNGEAELTGLWGDDKLKTGTITYNGKTFTGATDEKNGNGSIEYPDYVFVGEWRDFLPYKGHETITYHNGSTSWKTESEFNLGTPNKISARYGEYSTSGNKYDLGFPDGTAILSSSYFTLEGTFIPSESHVDIVINDLMVKDQTGTSKSVKNRLKADKLRLSHDGTRWALDGNIELSYSNGSKYNGEVTYDAISQIDVFYNDSIRNERNKRLERLSKEPMTMTFRNEQFLIGKQIFDSGTYQYYLDNDSEVKHGNISVSGDQIKVKGQYYHGLMDGEWTFTYTPPYAINEVNKYEWWPGTSSISYTIPFEKGRQIGVTKIRFKRTSKNRSFPHDKEISADIFTEDLKEKMILYYKETAYETLYRRNVNWYIEYKTTCNENGYLHGKRSFRRLLFDRGWDPYIDITEVFDNGMLQYQIVDGVKKLALGDDNALKIYETHPSILGTKTKLEPFDQYSHSERPFSETLAEVVSNMVAEQSTRPYVNFDTGNVDKNKYGSYLLSSETSPNFSVQNEINLSKQRYATGQQQHKKNLAQRECNVKRTTCTRCHGSGHDPQINFQCLECGGLGYIETMSH